MEKISNELDVIAKNNDIDLNNLNKNNVYNMKKMMKNVEMFRNKMNDSKWKIEYNEFTPEEIDKFFTAISNTLIKLEKNGNEGLKALSNWNTLLEVFNRLSQSCEYLFENTLTNEDLESIYEDIDNLYTLVYDILDFLSGLDLEGTLDDIYTQLSDLYSKYDSVLIVLKSIEDILEGIIASPLILLASSDSEEITVDGTTTLIFDLVFDGIDATEQIVPTDIIVDDFALNGLFIAEDEYTITDKHVTDFNKIQITIELNDPVILESFNGEVKSQVALLQCLCNTKIVSAGASPCTVLVTIQAVNGETHIPYISNTYYIDLSIILNGAYLSPMIDYTINRLNDEPTGYVESIDFNYPIHGKLVILEKYVGFIINTMTSPKQSPEEILEDLKLVDGTGSGLDADLLDGLESTAFVKKSGDTMTGPLSFGSVAATTPGNLSKHLQIYGNTYGINYYNQALNYVSQFSKHMFTNASAIVYAMIKDVIDEPKSLITKEYADVNYIKQSGGEVTGGLTIPSHSNIKESGGDTILKFIDAVDTREGYIGIVNGEMKIAYEQPGDLILIKYQEDGGGIVLDSPNITMRGYTVCYDLFDAYGGINVADGRLFIGANVTEGVSTDHLLTWDGTSGHVGRQVKSAVTVGNAERLGGLDSSEYVTTTTIESMQTKIDAMQQEIEELKARL